MILHNKIIKKIDRKDLLSQNAAITIFVTLYNLNHIFVTKISKSDKGFMMFGGSDVDGRMHRVVILVVNPILSF